MPIIGLLMSLGLLAAFTGMLDSDDDTVETTDVDEGTGGDDDYSGTESTDVLFAYDGDDTIVGGGGDDLLLANDDDDFVRGGKGDDFIVGGDGADTLEGASGDDVIDGTSLMSEDLFMASALNPSLYGGVIVDYDLADDTDDGDVIDGGNGDDTILIGSEDTVTGGTGSDELLTGFWIDPDAPAEVTDFDVDEDVLTYSYVGSLEPMITVEDDADGNATVLADGETVVILANAAGTVSADDIVLVREA